MEAKFNVFLLALIGAIWIGLNPKSPTFVSGESPQEVAAVKELIRLEDAFARDPMDREKVLALSERYLTLNRAGLAVAVLRQTDQRYLEDPQVAHQLSRAYELSGRVLDAYATADIALARCARAVGTELAPVGTDPPEHPCSAQLYFTLDIHQTALRSMVDWGVADPNEDPRALEAYRRALRSGRVALQ